MKKLQEEDDFTSHFDECDEGELTNFIYNILISVSRLFPKVLIMLAVDNCEKKSNH